MFMPAPARDNPRLATKDRELIIDVVLLGGWESCGPISNVGILGVA